MKFKKSLLIIALIICIFTMASVSATDVNDTAIASEDTDQMELSTDDGITEDNLQANNEETVSAETDSEILTDGQYTYSNLREQIGSGGNINLTKGTYTYNNDGDTIEISTSGVINGNGAVIDMAQSGHRAFTVSASGVTIKNLTIKNANYIGEGGAIYFDSTGTVTNCNFVDNKATAEDSWGGAISMYSGNVTNCNFVDNTAYYEGGAVWMYSGSVENCNFVDNTAYYEGGAISMYSGNVTNCYFADNSASQGGAILSVKYLGIAADTCIFKTDSDSTFNTRNLPPTLNVDNFTTSYGSGEKLTFDLKTNSSIPVTNGNISISIYSNNEWVRNYTCLSGEGWIPDLLVGSYIAVFNTEYAGFQPINRTLTVTDGTTFWDLNQTINGNTNATITLDNDYSFNPASDSAFTDGIVINRPVTIKGNGNAIDAKRQARIFYVQSANAVLENLTIINANSNGDAGAIYFSSSGTVTNCNFTNNQATGTNSWGGAIMFLGTGNVTNCNFTDNEAYNGGAVYFSSNGEVTNCNFTDNTAAQRGGALYFSSSGTTHEVRNCNFTDNKAGGDGGAIRMYSGSVENCHFTDNKAGGNGGAIYFLDQGTVTNCNFTNNQATGTNSGGGAIMFLGTGNVTNCNFTDNTAAQRGGAIFFSSSGTTHEVRNCNFTGNTANAGGAVCFYITGTVSNCNFTGNNATTGSAIYFYNWVSSDTLTVSNSTFLNNRANAGALDVVKNDNNITITFTGQNNLLNAIYSGNDAEVTFNNVKYWGANGITTVSAKLSGSNKAAGQNITVKGVVNGKIIDKINVTDENGEIVLDDAGDYWIIVSHKGDLYYTEIAETLFTNMKLYANVTSLTTNNKTVNITAKSNIFSEVMPGKLLFILPNGTEITANYASNGTWWAVHTFDAYDVYQVNATYVGLDNVTITNATISISKTPTEITVENATVELLVLDSVGTGATLTPSEAGELTFTSDNITVAKVEDGKIIAVGGGTAIITVSFAGNDDYAAAENKTITVKVIKYDSKVTIDPIADVVYPNNVAIKYNIQNKTNVTVKIAGVSDDKIIITNDTITVIGLDAGEYTITILNNESNLYHKSNDTKTFTVNKQATSITGSDVSTTYNINKDLVITLKDSNGNVLSGVKVTVDLNGAKTYTTDKNGQIKVPTKGLTPKTYTAKIAFAGNDNYLESNTTAKVTINKDKTKLTAKAVKATYNKNKNLVITLKDSQGKALSGAKVTVNLNGAKTYTTDKNGQIKINVAKLVPKKYTAKVTFAGNKNYLKSTADVKVTVKKAKAKIKAKKKTYKANKKTKKFKITLKDKNGKPIKKAKVRLIVKKIKKNSKKKTNTKTKKNKKKNIKKTNKKGKITFKIKRNKKGKYQATIKFYGNKYYKKATKKVKIKMK